MKISTLRIPASALIVSLVLLLPNWLEVSRARENAADFTLQGHQRQLEVRVLRSEIDLLNPFSWFGGKPTFVVARKARGENFLLLFSSYSDDDKSTNRALVSADCTGHRFRVVTQSKYEKYLQESLYTSLGDKLPPWESAGYGDMLAVLITQEIIPSDTSLFFAAACKWNDYKLAA